MVRGHPRKALNVEDEFGNTLWAMNRVFVVSALCRPFSPMVYENGDMPRSLHIMLQGGANRIGDESVSLH